ncbi:MAG: hypothetical protein R3251_04115, partial [Candidatus Spechtbacterales bacterium]|nr:hypothetical protein [Candidatus Spechtbacterales bacterium]
MNFVKNIGKKQRISRAIMGISGLVVTLFLVIFYIQEPSWYWYLIIFALTFSGVLPILEARSGVCPINAYRNKQSMRGWFSIGQEDLQDIDLSKAIKG